MKAGTFALRIAHDVDEAIELLSGADGDAKLLAGGQSLVPLMAFRLARPDLLVDINGVDELAYVDDDGAGLRIGAMTRQCVLARSEVVARACPLLAEAMPSVAHAPIRNRGTMGGSIAHADPGAELPMVWLTLDGYVSVRGPAGDRTVAAADFFSGPFMTVLEDAEVLTEIFLPAIPSGAGSAFYEVARRRGDFATVAVAAVLGTDADGSITYARLGYGSMGPTPMRARAAEAELVGQRARPDTFARAAAVARSELAPTADVHATAAYRAHLAEALTRRALETARFRSAGAGPAGSR